uniref:Uncharacterized protein n=1 Tax=Candidatus Kentrum sp. TC TaxID=2126339 RepID=A0A450Y8W2_9GAMM|nr:MAG: hypothetical protein BECKTC1821E_GA0114239_1001160 [Candidatus Kentron sp. TC]
MLNSMKYNGYIARIECDEEVRIFVGHLAGIRDSADSVGMISRIENHHGENHMLENDLFEQWLADEAARVLAKLKNNEPLTQDDKLIIVLKGQMNHFHHLDVELRQEILTLRQDMDRRFEEVNKRFDDANKRFDAIAGEIKQINEEIKRMYQAINGQTWKMIGAVGVIVLLGKVIENF